MNACFHACNIKENNRPPPYAQCPSKTFGGFDTTKDLPDDVVTFARSHPAMFHPVYPINNKPIMVKTDVDYQFTQIVVDKVEAEDGQYDVMFIGTGMQMNGLCIDTFIDKRLFSRCGVTLQHSKAFESLITIPYINIRGDVIKILTITSIWYSIFSFA